ncbi:Unknown protein [Striga hermonthica]|uniref:Ubiquitin-like protease family profile domain-containing protein n=1 Tax=Striga hermonthica TaxID=68872 RepID=A0A9N7R133_STRHE|nr:Unknown protein [Striga hermonthica]
MIDNADCDDFDWGTKVFEFTMHHLKKSTQYRKQIHKAGKPVTGGYLYRCYGFILALQLWFYEVCTSADGVICTCLSENDMPRMLKWEVRGSHNCAFMQRIFSNLDSSKFKNVIPTDEEKHTLFINDFFKSKNEFNRDEIPTTDHHQQKSEADVIKRLDRLTHEVETLKQIFLDFSNRVFAEFALFKEKFNILEQSAPVSGDMFDQVDVFSPLNTQFFEEVDRSTEEKLRNASKSKEPDLALPKVDIPMVADDGKALISSQPSFDLGLTPIDPSKLNNKPPQENPMDIITKVVHEMETGELGKTIEIQPSCYDVVLVPNPPTMQIGTSKTIEKPKKRRCVRKGIPRTKSCPFDVDFWEKPERTSDFIKWYLTGMLKTALKFKDGYIRYGVRSKVLKPPFDFNVAMICDKNWFCTMYESGCFLDSSHMDVLFYYLRKIGVHGTSAEVRYTTTDVMFDQHIKSLYAIYLSQSCNTTLCSVHDIITDYIMGYRLICGKSWFDVDHILFPMHVEVSGIGHWILGILTFSNMKFWVYNSYRSVEVDEIILESVQAYVRLLPIFLVLVNFYGKRTDVNTDAGGRIPTDVNSPFEVLMAANIPQQAESDCGIFVASYAEHFITNVDITTKKFNVDIERQRYTYLLYTHGRTKQINGYESDDDPPGSMPDDVRFSLLA